MIRMYLYFLLRRAGKWNLARGCLSMVESSWMKWRWRSLVNVWRTGVGSGDCGLLTVVMGRWGWGCEGSWVKTALRIEQKVLIKMVTFFMQRIYTWQEEDDRSEEETPLRWRKSFFFFFFFWVSMVKLLWGALLENLTDFNFKVIKGVFGEWVKFELSWWI